MRVIGQWDSLIQLLTTESAQELMGNFHSLLWLQGSAFSTLMKKKSKECSVWWIVCCLNTFLGSVQKLYQIIICWNHERAGSKYCVAGLSIAK